TSTRSCSRLRARSRSKGSSSATRTRTASRTKCPAGAPKVPYALLSALRPYASLRGVRPLRAHGTLFTLGARPPDPHRRGHPGPRAQVRRGPGRFGDWRRGGVWLTDHGSISRWSSSPALRGPRRLGGLNHARHRTDLSRFGSCSVAAWETQGS